MTEPVETRVISPLLALAEGVDDPAVRLAALDAACRFPLAEGAWRHVAGLLGQLIGDGPARLRGAALALAVRVPLRSVREHLRRLAGDPGDADHDTLVRALVAVGDPSQVGTLLAWAGAGDEEAFALLAAMPVEEVLNEADQVPAPLPDASATTRFWHALVRARLGDYGPLDEFLAGRAPEPELFHGSPWAAYDAIAAIRPVPGALGDHLLAMLAEPGESDRARLVRLTAWAATGIADAEGEAPALTFPPDIGVSPGDASAETAVELAGQLPERLFAGGLSAQERELLCGLPAERVAGLVTGLVAAGNRRAGSARAGHAGAIIEPPPGNQVVDLVGCLPRSDDWPAAALARQQLGADQPLLDDDQLAWVIARGGAGQAVRELAGLLEEPRPVAERLRILGLLGRAGDHLAGRGGSPYRGAGAGAGSAGAPAIGRGPLIDDRPLAAARAPSAPGRPGDEEAPLTADEPATGAADELDVHATAAPVAPAAAAPAAAGPGPDDTGPPAPGPEDRRRVHAQLRHEGRRRNTFVAGAETVIRCWIGLPERERAAVADRHIPHVAIPAGGLPLEVELCWGDQHDRQPLRLPEERTARTADCDLRIRVPEGERQVSALVLFRYRGRAFEVVQVSAGVRAPGEPEQPGDEVRVRVQASLREVIELPDRIPYDTCAVAGREEDAPPDARPGPTATLWMFGGTGAGRCDLEGTEAALEWLNQDLFTTQKSLVRRRAAQGAGADGALLDAADPEVLRLLRDMARHGSAIHKQLRAGPCRDPGERIQLLNLEPGGYVPLEFVYDRGYPADDATLCDGWLEALQSDAPACPACSRTAPTPRQLRWMPTICPLGFWSLQKIIERRDPAAGAEAGSAAHPSAPTAARRRLPVIDDVAFASSHYVPAEERQSTREALRAQFAAPGLADDWDQWLDALEASYRPLLVMLPHHDAEAGLDFLEIGDAQLPPARGHLSRGQLDAYYVNPRGMEPGPIVLLLGCRTGARTEVGYVQLARSFQQLHSSIVVGTLAQVLGRHAAPVARELVAQLLAVADGTVDFGAIMRRVRRRMLARGYLMALCLVALGDAEWRLTPRPAPGPAPGNGP